MSDGASDLAFLSAIELRRLIAAGDVSAREVASAFLSRIKAVDPSIRSFVTVVEEDRVLAAAEEAQSRIKEGRASPLAGVPYALKDLTETAGVRTTFGSRLRADYVPTGRRRGAAPARGWRRAAW
jgi:amidase